MGKIHRFIITEELQASAAVTASGNSSGFSSTNSDYASVVTFELLVTAAGGAGDSITFQPQTSFDGGTTWHDSGDPATVTATGNHLFTLRLWDHPMGKKFRLKWTHSQGSLTFSVNGYVRE